MGFQYLSLTASKSDPKIYIASFRLSPAGHIARILHEKPFRMRSKIRTANAGVRLTTHFKSRYPTLPQPLTLQGYKPRFPSPLQDCTLAIPPYPLPMDAIVQLSPLNSLKSAPENSYIACEPSLPSSPCPRSIATFSSAESSYSQATSFTSFCSENSEPPKVSAMQPNPSSERGSDPSFPSFSRPMPLRKASSTPHLHLEPELASSPNIEGPRQAASTSASNPLLPSPARLGLEMSVPLNSGPCPTADVYCNTSACPIFIPHARSICVQLAAPPPEIKAAYERLKAHFATEEHEQCILDEHLVERFVSPISYPKPAAISYEGSPLIITDSTYRGQQRDKLRIRSYQPKSCDTLLARTHNVQEFADSPRNSAGNVTSSAIPRQYATRRPLEHKIRETISVVKGSEAAVEMVTDDDHNPTNLGSMNLEMKDKSPSTVLPEGTQISGKPVPSRSEQTQARGIDWWSPDPDVIPNQTKRANQHQFSSQPLPQSKLRRINSSISDLRTKYLKMVSAKEFSSDDLKYAGFKIPNHVAAQSGRKGRSWRLGLNVVRVCRKQV